MSIVTPTKKASLTVGMGQVLVTRSGETFSCVLGSCIALVIYHPRLKVGAMAHIVLPNTSGKAALPGKYADVAIPHMIDLLTGEGAAEWGLAAKLAGGSRMFGNKGPAQVGDNNIETVLRILEELHVHVQGKHVGGKKGRRIVWDPDSGDLTIHIVGKPLQVI